MKILFPSPLVHKLIAVSAVLLATALAGGCATPTTSQGMTPTAIQTAARHDKTVSLKVSGGQETEAIGKSQISNAAYAQALTDAINNSKIFSSVIQGNGGDYLLTVTIFNMDQPSFGLTFTVKMEAGWQLKRVSDGSMVWQESIKSENTATTGDAFAAVTRLRLATEGAARKNIEQGLSRISALKL
ncbi:MAG: hypothetical protein KBE22_05165 [Candidatus Accumulibacter sp.]|jgi:hypothetical protein|nr:hypothetical protein [Accumulibacter sp.]